MSVPNPVRLDVLCSSCGGAVTLRMSDWPTDMALHHATLEVTPINGPTPDPKWTCPYCQRENSGGFPGRMAWVSKRATEDRPR